jgi:hypothetical protein
VTALFIAKVTFASSDPDVPPRVVPLPAYHAADLPSSAIDGSQAVRVEDNVVLTFARDFGGWLDSGLVWTP